MTEFEMMIKMLQRVAPEEGKWFTDSDGRAITLTCEDEWFNRTFFFDEKGELVAIR